MNSHPLTANSCPPTLITLLLICTTINGQSTGSIEGQVTDQNNAVVFAARIRASSGEILVDRSAVTFALIVGQAGLIKWLPTYRVCMKCEMCRSFDVNNWKTYGPFFWPKHGKKE